MQETGYGPYMGGYDDLEQRRATYAAALDLMRRAITPEWYEEAARMFESVVPFEDAGSLAGACHEKAMLYYEQRETERKDKVYATAMDHISAGSYELAAEIFGTIPGWRDANGQRAYCHQKIEELRRKKEDGKRKKNRRIIFAIVATAVVSLGFYIVVAVQLSFDSWNAYRRAMDAYESGDYEEAYGRFWDLAYGWGDGECEEMVRESAYYWAIDLYVDGRYQEAYSKLSELNDVAPYRDSVQLAGDILREHPTVARVGDIITFGRYEQDNNLLGGKEDIEWVVYWKSGTVIYAVSQYILDCQPYDVNGPDAKWEECSLNVWLNGSFYQEAFDEKEREMILASGDDGESGVFLLNRYDVQTYFPPDGGWRCGATAYAWAAGVSKDGGSSSCGWWMEDDDGICQVVSDEMESDVEATREGVGVRPVIRLVDENPE